jgi:N-acetylneuraminate lyase
MKLDLTGLIPAVFTPLDADGSLRLSKVPSIVDHLERDGVSGIYVLGSTGEGVSLSSEERRDVAEAYVQAASGRLRTIVQVGHNSLTEARRLASHAQEIGADAISVLPPFYDPPESVDRVIACLADVVSGAPELPLYYYHIPGKTGVEIDIEKLCRVGADRLPTLAGVKYSDPNLQEFQRGDRFLNDDLDFFLGVDEMLLGALATGVDGAVGSTYNFAAPLYRKIIDAFERGDLAQARDYQTKAVKMIDVILDHCGRPGLKAMMSVIGEDCGGQRLPKGTAEPEAVEEMERELRRMGFFEWGRKRTSRTPAAK